MHMRRSVWSMALLMVLVWPGSASAEVPETFTYTGQLQKDGQAYDGMVSATFTLYDSETGGQEVWSESVSSLQVQNGQFVAQLGSKNPFEETFDGKDLWLEVAVEGTTLSPRNHIGSLPYAHRAEVADTADNAQTVGGQEVSEITSSASQNVDAQDVSYDNSSSGLSASNTKGAIDEVAALKTEIQNLRSQLQDKADKTTVQDKADGSRVDSLETTVQSKADASSVYSKSDVDSKLSNKADASSVYTKTEADSMFATKTELGNYYTQSEVDSKLANKADSSSV